MATALVAAAQAGSAVTGEFALLFLGRVGTGFGFGIMNSAVNLAAGRTAHPARSISLGIAVQTILYSGVSIGLPMIGERFGVEGMFLALAGLALLLGSLALLLPGGADPTVGTASRSANGPIGSEGKRILIAMALFAFGSLAIWPFIERTAHAIGIPATRFGQFQSMAVLASALGNAILAMAIKKLSRSWPLAVALGACGIACALFTTVSTEMAFGGAFISYMVSWFLTYPLLLGLAYAHDASGRLAVMTTGTWLLSQSLGSLVAGFVAQSFGGYTPIGPLGAIFCILAIAIAMPVARRLDR